jgi:acetyl-CoA/propionyl-CoA carboxylase biotin carboxyl carrier protein
MLRALGELEIEGVATTVPAHRVLLAHPDFIAGNHSTKWVEEDLGPEVFALEGAHAVAAVPPTASATDGPEVLSEHTVPVEIDGKRFTVKVWLPDPPAAPVAPAHAPAAARPRPRATKSASAGGGSGMVTAPMQGTIVSVVVAPGDAVEVGQAVVVLEAMKMENHITAERTGHVKEVRVKAGDAVGAGDILLVIE